MYPYWKRDTEKGLWKSNISAEDKVPVLFKNSPKEQTLALLSLTDTLALHQQLLGLAAFPCAPGKRCRSDARSPPGDSTGHRHRLPSPGTATGHRHRARRRGRAGDTEHPRFGKEDWRLSLTRQVLSAYLLLHCTHFYSWKRSKS